MATATVVGLGNIGSAITTLVARMPGITGIILVDPDSYDESNLATQMIDRSALGKPKVEVQAASVLAINPRIQVETFEEPVENVPLESLRSSVFISCVDSRRARQSINRIAWRCSSPLIDAAVDAPSLIRINAYSPGEKAPCLECSWDQASYDLLEQDYPCDAADLSAPATMAPAELGLLAASLQAAELRKLINPAPNQGNSLVGAQLMLDTSTHEQYLAQFKYTRDCRFDHFRWEVETVNFDLRSSRLADLFDAAQTQADPVISLEGHVFATHLDCIACGKRSTAGLSLYHRLPARARRCPCGGQMFAPGFFSFETLQRSDLSPANLDLKLTALGFRYGDVITVDSASSRSRHLGIGAGQADE